MAERDRKLKELVSFLQIAPVYPNQMPYKQTGEKKWTVFKGCPWPQRVLSDGIYPYAVLPSAELRIAELPRPFGKISHPELVGGRDVIAAGMLILKGGSITMVSNESGHYCPDADSLTFTLRVLRHWGVPLLEPVKIDGKWICT